MSWPAGTCWGPGELSSGNPSARTIWSARYAKSWTRSRVGLPLVLGASALAGRGRACLPPCPQPDVHPFADVAPWRRCFTDARLGRRGRATRGTTDCCRSALRPNRGYVPKLATIFTPAEVAEYPREGAVDTE